MSFWSNVSTLAVVVSVSLAPAMRAQNAPDSYPARCGMSGVATDRGNYLPLPGGDVFCPLIADPKTTRSFAAYQRGNETDLATDIAAVGVADAFPFFRAAASRSGNGIQLGLAGAVFAQFDLGTASYDLLNADYLIGLPLTFRAGPMSGRLRVYHQSSHLGDEFLLRPNPPKRQNLSFESAEALLSIDVSALRIYGGGIADPRTHYYTRLFIDAAQAVAAARRHPASGGRPVVTTERFTIAMQTSRRRKQRSR